MKYLEKDLELKAILTVASLMVAAAKTAPKERGINSLETLVVDGEEKKALAEEMRKIGTQTNQEYFLRDADNIEQSACVVLFGATGEYHNVGHCGVCGVQNCGTARKLGVLCSYNIIDLGIALGSAVSVASMHHIDNRIMCSVGQAALSLRFFSENIPLIYGIPLSVSSKNPFHDRMPVKAY
jgi:uncharacterized ferredoxin-like protein